MNRKRPILLRDNARPDISQTPLKKLLKLGYKTLFHPPYSSDLCPAHYHFCKYLCHFLREKVFKDQTAAHNAFDVFVTRTPEFYLAGINKLVFLRGKYMQANGIFFD